MASPSHDLFVGLLTLGAIPTVGLVILFVRVWVRAQREEPVLDRVRAFPWKAEWDERAYQRQLGRYLRTHLESWQKLDAPLATGTKVDVVLRKKRAEFHVTIKLGLDNQKRLILMGELEDIITDCREREGNEATIVVIIGRRATEEASGIEFQIQALEAHIAKKRHAVIHDRGKRDFDFHIICLDVQSSGAMDPTAE